MIELGLEKRAGKLNLTWQEIGDKFGVDGESVRQAVKYHLQKEGKLQGKFEAGREKILILTDQHIPNHQESMILDIIRKNKDVDTIILGGDVLDCHAVSSWYDENITILDHELIEAHKLLMKIRAITKAKIVLVKGNHEQRVNNHFAKNAKVMGSAVVETEILYKLAHGFTVKYTNLKQRTCYEPIENVMYSEGRSFYYGDLLVNHPSIFRKQNMATVKIMWEEKLKNKYPDAQVIVIGHTHQLGLVYYEDARILIEAGCTCFPNAYADNDDRPFKLQQYGYVYLEMKDGVCQKDTIKITYLGHDDLTPKEEDVEDEY
jgi:predicted phosphodiesterase